MNDHRIHECRFENGRCVVCGYVPSIRLNIEDRLDAMDSKLTKIKGQADAAAMWAMIGGMLGFMLFLRGCS